MDIDVERRGGSLLLVCTGRLVRGSHCEWLLAPFENLKVHHVVIDCRRVERIDAYGIGILVSAATQGRSAGIDLELRDVPPGISDVLRLCGVADILFGAPRQEACVA